MSDPLTVVAYVRAQPGKESHVLEKLTSLLAPTRAEAGCIDYELHQSHDDPAKFVFYENWESAADLDAHAQSAHIQAFRILVPELLDGSVEISTWKKVKR